MIIFLILESKFPSRLVAMERVPARVHSGNIQRTFSERPVMSPVIFTFLILESNFPSRLVVMERVPARVH
jgi:hypothetical protein